MAVGLGPCGRPAVSAADRRAVLRLAAGMLLLPWTSVAAAHPARPATGFAPPDGPMLYTRRLERALAGGARLVVSRSFAVRFRHAAEGFKVEGEQVGVEVEAPESLAGFARIE